MEIILLILAATYAVSGKHQKDTSVAAYKSGKEPPGLVKARLRHERGGGRFSTSRGGVKTPKGPGATRLLIASRWAAACEKTKTKQEDKLKRWKAWYEEQAPQRDQAWRDKQNRKMAKRAERLDAWQGRWTRTKNAVAALKDSMGKKDTDSGDTTPEQPVQPDTAARSDTDAQSSTSGQTGASSTGADASEPSASGASPNTSTSTGNTTSTTTTTGGASVYQQGAATMHNHADEVEGYEKALTALGQDLEAVGWGAEVHGPLADMHTKLQAVAGRYRDLAETTKHQGDKVNDSYDEAPWAPDRAALAQ